MVADPPAGSVFARLLKSRWKSFRPGLPACAGIIFIALFAVYAGSLRSGFVDFDDAEGVYSARGFTAERPAAYFRDLWELDPAQFLTKLLIQRPLRDLTFLADKRLYGNDPWGFHLSNLLWQYAASLAAFLAASLLLGSRPAGLLAALLFTLHPAQTESIAYIAGRRDILSGALCLLSLWLAGLALKERPALWWASAGAWLLALFAKQSAVALPLAATPLLLAAFPPETRALLRRADWKAKAAAAAAAAGLLLYAGINAYSELVDPGGIRETELLFGGSALAQALFVPVALGQALYKALLPLKLVGDYSYAAILPVLSPADWRLWAALAALGLLAGALIKARRALPLAAAGGVFFLLAYAPTLPLLPTVHNLEVFAEHWLYLPLFGLAVSAAALLRRLHGARPRLALALGAFLLIAYAVRSHLRVPAWRDPMTFWETTVKDSPRCARAMANLGALYSDLGRATEAEGLYLRALELRPGYPAPLLNLARLRLAAGDPRGALRLIDEAAAAPGAMLQARAISHERGLARLALGDLRAARVLFSEARMHRPAFYNADMTRGYALASRLLGEKAEAEKYYRLALELSPSHYHSLSELGALLHDRGDYPGAAALLERALAARPRSAEAAAMLAAARSARGDYRGALEAAVSGRYADPGSALPYRAASMAYRRAGRFRAALGSARRGLRLDGTDPGLHLERGLALRELGDINGALEAYERSLTLDPRNPQAYLSYADALLAAGYAEGARRAAAKALQLKPGYTAAESALRLLGSARPPQHLKTETPR